MDEGDANAAEALADLQDLQKTYIREVETSGRLGQRHGLSHRPQSAVEVALLQLEATNRLVGVMENIHDVMRTYVCSLSTSCRFDVDS